MGADADEGREGRVVSAPAQLLENVPAGSLALIMSRPDHVGASLVQRRDTTRHQAGGGVRSCERGGAKGERRVGWARTLPGAM